MFIKIQSRYIVLDILIGGNSLFLRLQRMVLTYLQGINCCSNSHVFKHLVSSDISRQHIARDHPSQVQHLNLSLLV